MTAIAWSTVPHFYQLWHGTLLSFLTGIFNILGLPVTQCPLGLSAEGLPLGLQLVVGKQQDRLSLATAVFLEKTFGGWRDPGSIATATTQLDTWRGASTTTSWIYRDVYSGMNDSPRRQRNVCTDTDRQTHSHCLFAHAVLSVVQPSRSLTTDCRQVTESLVHYSMSVVSPSQSALCLSKEPLCVLSLCVPGLCPKWLPI